ncbi:MULTISPECIES: helix-turn-helix domain-containing protein [unclassified Brevibacterium]|uniref:helix-turn-helix domain-containing protein n=1 Tax=unclassified Brevibacterium TaxID=2614124 RepID=UPI0010920C3F|nr:helix-turn-helix domain-containing protein [Brevibacterium sp. S22]TGD30421.1 transcriptional regulator [Brevibacterium sp. S22]
MDSTLLLEDAYQRAVRRAHERLAGPSDTGLQTRSSGPVVRTSVLESWDRSLARLRDPDSVQVQVAFEADRLAEVRRRHPFHAIMPLLRSHLIEPARDAGLLAALGDEQGRLLWVEGERGVRNRAEAMGFVSGSDWSEEVMGTSAPALALRSGRPVQVSQAEHFAPDVRSWSCSAVPVTHPLTGQVIGIIDVTGGDDAVSSIVLPLLSSTAKAAGAQLSQLFTPQQIHTGTEAVGTRLTVLGPSPALEAPGGRRIPLTRRHAEILLLLHRFPEGISGAGLVERLWTVGGSEVTVRAEINRLRRTIGDLGDLRIEARPYRLRGDVDSDLERTVQALAKGDADSALERFSGTVLPDSEAPGVREIGAEVDALMRETLLQEGTWQQLWRFANLPDFRDDVEVLMTVLRLAPPEAAERNAAVVRLEALGL